MADNLETFKWFQNKALTLESSETGMKRLLTQSVYRS